MPYYNGVVDANNVKVATSKGEPGSRTFVTIAVRRHNIVKWTSNPVISSFSVDSFARRAPTPATSWWTFTTDWMANANFVPTVSGFYSGLPDSSCTRTGWRSLRRHSSKYDSGGLPLAVNKVFLSIFGVRGLASIWVALFMLESRRTSSGSSRSGSCATGFGIAGING